MPFDSAERNKADQESSVPGSCFYLTTYEACKAGLAPYLVAERPDGKPPTLLAQALLIVSAAMAAECASLVSPMADFELISQSYAVASGAIW